MTSTLLLSAVAQHGAGVVRGGVKSKRASTRRCWGGIREKRVTRRCSNPFADSVRQPDEQHLRRASRHRGEGPYHGRDSVTNHDQALTTADFVGPPSAQKLEQRRRRLGHALDGADEARVRAEHAGEEHWKQRINHLGRDVGEKTHRAQAEDVSPEFRLRVAHRGRLYDACTSE